MDLNSFMNTKLQKKKFKSKEYDEITDLIESSPTFREMVPFSKVG